MSKFFQEIIEFHLEKQFAPVLDWLFDDNKFNEQKGWSSRYMVSLTKKIKRMEDFSIGNTYYYGTIKSLVFPQNRPNIIAILFSKRESESKDLIRHIRNGIAHGNAKIIMQKNEQYIEIKDYDSKRGTQTAYFYFPIFNLIKIYKLYLDTIGSINKSKNDSRRNHVNI